MICETLKKGIDCVFMSKNGCGYNGGSCFPVVEQCAGCDRVEEYPTGMFCGACADPRLKWKTGHCNFSTHIKRESAAPQKVLNALKASKRKAAGRL